MGSKSQIAPIIIQLLPKATNFYDLFAGGCSVTHCALWSGKYNNIIANDLNGDMVQLFIDACNGKYHNEKRWISRELFEELKDKDPYVANCWSFGNNLRAYMYSTEVEPWKRALWYARVYHDYSLLKEFHIISNGSCLDIKKNHEKYKLLYVKWYLKTFYGTELTADMYAQSLKDDIKKETERLRLWLCDKLKKSGHTQAEVDKFMGTQMSGHYFGKSQWGFPTREAYEKLTPFLKFDKTYDEIYGASSLLQRLQSLESLPSLECLQRLQSLESLGNHQNLDIIKISKKSYEKVEILPDSVIYCDIPYENTAEYVTGEFNHKNFYDWACNQSEFVVISSYNISDNRFRKIVVLKKNSLLQGGRGEKRDECLYIRKDQKDLWDKMHKKEE